MGINISSWLQNNKVKEWRPRECCYDNTLESDMVAGPLKAPYTPSEVDVISSTYRPVGPISRTPGGNGKLMLFNSSFNQFTTPSTNTRRTEIQTHSLFQTVNHIENGEICPVSMTTTRHLAPVKVGTGIVLSRVVDMLQNIHSSRPPKDHKFLSLPSTPLSHRLLPLTPTHSTCSVSSESVLPFEPDRRRSRLISDEELFFEESELFVPMTVPPNTATRQSLRTLTRNTN